MSTITDIKGTEVLEDHLIAVATSGYNHHPQIRVGQVLGFHSRVSNTSEVPDQIEVFWHHTGSNSDAHMVGTTSRIDATKKRFVVIGKAVSE